MSSLEAARAIEAALPHVSIKDALALLAERADALREEADHQDDKWARIRAAADHRALLNLRDKIHN